MENIDKVYTPEEFIEYMNSIRKRHREIIERHEREMREQEGYDVTAAPRKLDGIDTLPFMMHDSGWANAYEKGRDSLVQCFSNSRENVKKKVVNKLIDWGDGARVIVRVQWTVGGGHVFIAENQGEKVIFIDPQNNTLDASQYFECCKTKSTYVLRIDDKKFTGLIEDCCE